MGTAKAMLGGVATGIALGLFVVNRNVIEAFGVDRVKLDPISESLS